MLMLFPPTVPLAIVVGGLWLVSFLLPGIPPNPIDPLILTLIF